MDTADNEETKALRSTTNDNALNNNVVLKIPTAKYESPGEAATSGSVCSKGRIMAIVGGVFLAAAVIIIVVVVAVKYHDKNETSAIKGTVSTLSSEDVSTGRPNTSQTSKSTTPPSVALHDSTPHELPTGTTNPVNTEEQTEIAASRRVSKVAKTTNTDIRERTTAVTSHATANNITAKTPQTTSQGPYETSQTTSQGPYETQPTLSRGETTQTSPGQLETGPMVFTTDHTTNTGFTGVTTGQRIDVGSTTEQITNAGFTRFTTGQSTIAGFTMGQRTKSGSTGVTMGQMTNADFTGFTTGQKTFAGVTTGQMTNTGFTTGQMIYTGFTIEQMTADSGGLKREYTAYTSTDEFGTIPTSRYDTTAQVIDLTSEHSTITPRDSYTDITEDNPISLETSPAEFLYSTEETSLDDIIRATTPRGRPSTGRTTAHVTTGSPSTRPTSDYTTTGSPLPDWPANYGVNMDVVSLWHPGGRARAGQATDTHTCHSIRDVPPELRNQTVMFRPISDFYQKYTETYGIPIIGSRNVTDFGLQRACYLIHFLLSSRYDIRNAIYKLYVRVALIADDEQQTSLPEYSTWDPTFWNNRARGLGPTMGIPLVSVGDDNQRCELWNRYPSNDILLHEFSHCIHLMGAQFVIPNFTLRLSALYHNAHTAGKYGNTSYIMTNKEEYFAEGSCIYFGAYTVGNYKFLRPGDTTLTTINGRQILQEYDPEFVQLLDEVHSCSPNRPIFVDRCAYRQCNFILFNNSQSMRMNYRSSCISTAITYGQSIEACAEAACNQQTYIFTFYQSSLMCMVKQCASTSDTDLQLAFRRGYVTYVANVPPASNVPEIDIPINSLCLRNTNSPSQCNVSLTQRVQCGPRVQTSDQCLARGGCGGSQPQCYYKTQDCFDKQQFCADGAVVGACQTNPVVMRLNCSLSCNFCSS